MTSTSFRTTVETHGRTATGLEVPESAVETLASGKKPSVTVTIGDYSYRSTVAVMGGRYLIPLSAEHRKGSGLSAGDEVEVTLELDTEPRVLVVPDDLTAALDAEPAARTFFDGLSYSNQRRWVLSVEDAKTDETRQRRITKTVDSMLAGKKQ